MTCVTCAEHSTPSSAAQRWRRRHRRNRSSPFIQPAVLLPHPQLLPMMEEKQRKEACCRGETRAERRRDNERMTDPQAKTMILTMTPAVAAAMMTRRLPTNGPLPPTTSRSLRANVALPRQAMTKRRAIPTPQQCRKKAKEKTTTRNRRRRKAQHRQQIISSSYSRLFPPQPRRLCSVQKSDASPIFATKSTLPRPKPATDGARPRTTPLSICHFSFLRQRRSKIIISMTTASVKSPLLIIRVTMRCVFWTQSCDQQR